MRAEDLTDDLELLNFTKAFNQTFKSFNAVARSMSTVLEQKDVINKEKVARAVAANRDKFEHHQELLTRMLAAAKELTDA